MPKRTDIKSILLLGAGPIVIGQACEFDYSGTQACKALREEGYRIILVNSNPATIMTDPDMADAIYIEPIDWQTVEKIIEKDDTTDSSLSFIWDMGVLPPDDPRIVSTMEDIEKNLTNKTGGLCRYRGDRYQRNKNHNYSETISGNTWVISTLWLANWKIAIAKNQKDLKKAKDLIEWVESQANSAGILPEQIDPFENKHISVAPLTWSQSSFLDTVQRFSEKYDKLNIK